MKKVMKTVLEVFFMSHSFQIETKLPKKRILRWIELFVCENEEDYGGWLEDDGFTIEEWRHKALVFGFRKNTAAPVAKAKITEKEDGSVIDVTVRTNRGTQIFLIPFRLFVLIGACFDIRMLFIFFFLLFFVDFLSVFLPARRLKKKLVALFEEETKNP